MNRMYSVAYGDGVFYCLFSVGEWDEFDRLEEKRLDLRTSSFAAVCFFCVLSVVTVLHSWH